jgi:hypothetical protein
MRAEELDNLTEDELQQRANDCFIQADNTNFRVSVGGFERLRLHLEAQFYMTAVARKRDDRTARRDFWMEVSVIVLISIEIILSLVFGFLALREGRQQAKILSQMDTSTGATATAMQAASLSLTTLANDQAKSLDRLRQMSDSLQSSLRQTGIMASANSQQLKILREEQAARLAELAKKPKLALFIGGKPASTPNQYIPPSAESDTSLTDEVVLRNIGDATAHHVTVRVIINATDVGLAGEGTVRPVLFQPQPDPALRAYIIQIDFIRPTGSVPIELAFTFPKGHGPFQVVINTDADEVEPPIELANLTVRPRPPQG